MPGRSDPTSVGKHEDEHLRRFVAARRDGDADEMRRCWEEVVIDFYDRMDGLVAGVHKGRLDDDEHEAAVSVALVKFGENLMHTFEGVSMGELVNASKALAKFVCMDVQRSSMRRREHEGPSLDAVREGPDGDVATHGWAEVDQAWDDLTRREEQQDAADTASWALDQLDERSRRLLEMDLRDADISEIMQELNVSAANAHKIRSRALKKLRELLEGQDA